EDREHVEGGAARAAVLLCDRGAEQARVGGLAMQFARDLAGALPLVQVGDDLLAREVGGELTERLLLVGVPADHFGGGHAYSPFQTGSRFCMKAMTPSRVSALVVRRARALSVSSQGRSSAGTLPSMMPRATVLLACTASGAPFATSAARARAVSRTSACGTTRLTRPQRSASADDIGLPVRTSSIATARGMAWPMRKTPPAPAIRPRCTSGRPNSALSEATTRSLARASSVPPPRAVPLTAAMTGLEMWCLTTPAKPQCAVSGGVTPSGPLVPRALRSAP